ncbi:DedA family protein [Ruminiclostridium cellulolyticum]|uniref:SNARE associated Golgi protein n=2 Tax=Ruminiclostridium cellulolyticum TaxID=1521 RepID=B8I7U8_RUMCH|nr:DedA family protein [Ruminiclostridium cellulolyticum]ABB97518.1 unknown [Ruminiclostridium cellulolyticum H10]ACL75105.1 SNARE associated Golgi protein [Ruminiclostridium cellulolyticum H10]
MQNFIFNLIHHVIENNVIVTYLFFFLSGILQLVFPPFPSDVIIVFEGYLTTLGGQFHFIPVMINSILGSLIGSILVYWFGYKKGNEVLRYKIVLKYIDEKHIKRSEKVFHKYGKYGLILSKFIPGTSTIMVLFSGVFRVEKKVCFSYVMISIILQQLVYLLIGRLIGNNIDAVNRFLSYFNIFSVAILACFVIVGFVLYKVKKSKKRVSTDNK